MNKSDHLYGRSVKYIPRYATDSPVPHGNGWMLVVSITWDFWQTPGNGPERIIIPRCCILTSTQWRDSWSQKEIYGSLWARVGDSYNRIDWGIYVVSSACKTQICITQNRHCQPVRRLNPTLPEWSPYHIDILRKLVFAVYKMMVFPSLSVGQSNLTSSVPSIAILTSKPLVPLIIIDKHSCFFSSVMQFVHDLTYKSLSWYIFIT